MKIHGFVLGVVLLVAVGWCMVMESIKQTQARYELADLSRREEEARQSLDALRAEEQELRSPARLAALVREKRLKFVFLGSAMPSDADIASGRRPGQTLDQPPAESAITEEMASAGQLDGAFQAHVLRDAAPEAKGAYGRRR